MSSKGPLQQRRRSSSPRNLYDERIKTVFDAVKRFVSSKTSGMASTTIHIDCPLIFSFRKENPGYLGERALMHVGCGRLMICTLRWVAGIADGNLVALFLHEFGHLGGGSEEPEANRWVRKNFGIEIEYKGPLDLQWVPPDVVRRIFQSSSTRS